MAGAYLASELHEQGINAGVVVIIDLPGGVRDHTDADILFGLLRVVKINALPRVKLPAVIPDPGDQAFALDNDTDIRIIPLMLFDEAVPEHISPHFLHAQGYVIGGPGRVGVPQTEIVDLFGSPDDVVHAGDGEVHVLILRGAESGRELQQGGHGEAEFPVVNHDGDQHDEDTGDIHNGVGQPDGIRAEGPDGVEHENTFLVTR